MSFRTLPGLQLSAVGSESQLGVYQAVSYLIKTYRRPVQYIGEQPAHDHFPERYLAYSSAMVDAGYAEEIHSHTFHMDTDSTDAVYWPMDRKWMPGYQAACRLLDHTPVPVSVMAKNDYVAQGVYKAAAERTLLIGRDVLLIGSDDLSLASNLSPSLTTLHAAPKEIGYHAAKLLHQIIERTIQGPKMILLPMELIKRESA